MFLLQIRPTTFPIKWWAFPTLLLYIVTGATRRLDLSPFAKIYTDHTALIMHRAAKSISRQKIDIIFIFPLFVEKHISHETPNIWGYLQRKETANSTLLPYKHSLLIYLFIFFFWGLKNEPMWSKLLKVNFEATLLPWTDFYHRISNIFTKSVTP